MQRKHILKIVETHTGGQPTRTIVGGLDPIPGKTMWDKYVYVQTHCDLLRTMVCQEPRGSEIMSGALLTEPCDPEAQIGVLHFEAAGWLPMCGHNTIGVCTVLTERDLVPTAEPETCITMDTPAGIIRAAVTMENGQATAVRFRAVPSFPLLLNGVIETERWGDLPVEIGWGGSAVAFVKAAPFQMEICPENAVAYERLAAELMPRIKAKYPVTHPALPHVKSISHLAFYTDEGARRHVVIGPDGHCDRSPCGNGTCARAALLYAKGLLKPGDSFEQYSVMGSRFTCTCVGETMIEGTPAMVPEISGRAWQTAESTYFVSETDPLGLGFSLA